VFLLFLGRSQEKFEYGHATISIPQSKFLSTLQSCSLDIILKKDMNTEPRNANRKSFHVNEKNIHQIISKSKIINNREIKDHLLVS